MPQQSADMCNETLKFAVKQDYTPEQFAEAVKSMETEGNPIKYVALRKGTVVPAGQEDSPGGNHVNT